LYLQQIYSLLAAPSVILIIFSDKSRMSLRKAVQRAPSHQTSASINSIKIGTQSSLAQFPLLQILTCG
jgi:hypothetical protein